VRRNSRTEENKIPKSASGPQITHTTNSNNKKLQEQLSPFNTFPTIAEQRPLEGKKKKSSALLESTKGKTERQPNRFKRKKKRKKKRKQNAAHPQRKPKRS
jgi:hypothetical protein